MANDRPRPFDISTFRLEKDKGKLIQHSGNAPGKYGQHPTSALKGKLIQHSGNTPGKCGQHPTSVLKGHLKVNHKKLNII